MVDVFEIANNARNASDAFSAANVGRVMNAADWLRCWNIEADAADACGLALRTAAAIGEPAYVVKEWQAAVDLHLAFASAARSNI